MRRFRTSKAGRPVPSEVWDKNPITFLNQRRDYLIPRVHIVRKSMEQYDRKPGVIAMVAVTDV